MSLTKYAMKFLIKTSRYNLSIAIFGSLWSHPDPSSLRCLSIHLVKVSKFYCTGKPTKRKLKSQLSRGNGTSVCMTSL